MTVCARATSWVSALMNFLTTQWVFIIDFNLWDPCSHIHVCNSLFFVLAETSALLTMSQTLKKKLKKNYESNFAFTMTFWLRQVRVQVFYCWAIGNSILMPLKLDSCDTVIVIFYSQIWALLQGDKIYIYIHVLYICMYMCMYKALEFHALSN